MMHHKAVGLDYVEKRMNKGQFVYLKDTVAWWRSLGYTFAPPCYNVTPNGRCAGHQRKED